MTSIVIVLSLGEGGGITLQSPLVCHCLMTFNHVEFEKAIKVDYISKASDAKSYSSLSSSDRSDPNFCLLRYRNNELNLNTSDEIYTHCILDVRRVFLSWSYDL